MSWLQAGQGRPVVLLHAFPMAAEMWRPQLVTVPHGRMLVAPDLPGFGPGDADTAAEIGTGPHSTTAAGALATLDARAGGSGEGNGGIGSDSAGIDSGGRGIGSPAATTARAVAAASVDAYADSVLALLRHLDIEQAAIGGLSMGGYVTFAIAR